jgi:cytochrome c-type biogenesis protein
VFLGASLLSAYSVGMAIPFLIAAVGIGWVTTILRKYGKLLHYVEIIMGIILVILGVMLMFNILPYLSRFGSILNLGL